MNVWILIDRVCDRMHQYLVKVLVHVFRDAVRPYNIDIITIVSTDQEKNILTDAINEFHIRCTDIFAKELDNAQGR